MNTTRLSGLPAARSLLINLTLRENRSKYKRSAMGWLWSMVNPLATMLVFSFVFGVFFNIDPPVGSPSGLKNFAFFLIAALLPWNFLAAGLSSATGSVIANAGLIKKVYFPRSVLPAANVLSANTNLLIELGVLSVALLIAGQVVFPFLPLALVVIGLQMLFVLGLGMALASLNVYFRDIEHLLQILLLLWFYSTPILYPISFVRDAVVGGLDIPLKALYQFNPMVHFTQAYRSIFYDLKIPPAATFGWMALSAGIAMTVGWLTFRKLQDRFAEEL
ncbi:MAG: ABC transporter permease [Actinomycetota bacterium]